MQYRPLGKTGLNVSAFALGCMRLPAENPELAAQIVDEAIASGVNYFETTRGYIGGRCQHLVAPGLKGRSRGLIVSGKAGISAETTADSYRQEIALQMEILGVDYLEFFQVGWFSADRLEMLTKKGGALDALDQARAEGLIGHIGCTGHDTPENYTKIVESGIFDSITIPYNMISRQYAPTIARAGQLGVGVIAMCAVSGGILASPSPQLQALIPGGATSTAAAALQFVLANPDVSCACSGMKDLEMLRENVATVNAFADVSPAQFAEMDRVLDQFRVMGDRLCTYCKYCMDCPNGVDIPFNFHLYMFTKVYSLMDWPRAQYAAMAPEKRADACTRCGACAPKCPNSISIMEQLEAVARVLG